MTAEETCLEMRNLCQNCWGLPRTSRMAVRRNNLGSWSQTPKMSPCWGVLTSRTPIWVKVFLSRSWRASSITAELPTGTRKDQCSTPGRPAFWPRAHQIWAKQLQRSLRGLHCPNLKRVDFQLQWICWRPRRHQRQSLNWPRIRNSSRRRMSISKKKWWKNWGFMKLYAFDYSDKHFQKAQCEQVPELRVQWEIETSDKFKICNICSLWEESVLLNRQ